MKIPFSPPYIDNSVITEVMDSLTSGWITTGPKVKLLEDMVCKYTGCEKTLCVNSATSGLILALKWLGVKQGDEVIIPAYTYAATALAVLHCGAKPVIVDVKDDFNIDLDAVQKAISKNTKAIIPVDIAGFPCDYSELMKLAENNINEFVPASANQQQLGRILILSDAAHSLGANYKGRTLGTSADITIFSFHAVKNVTTAEGGAVCLNLPAPFDNENEYKFLRCYSLNGQTKDAFTKSQGGSWKYDIIYQGLKINMPDVLAAIGVAQIPTYFEVNLDKRRFIFEFYNKFFEGLPWAILPPFIDDDKISSGHIYMLRIKNCSENKRDEIIEKISNFGIAVNVHFQPLPLLSLFKELGYSISNYPSAFKNYSCEISLPIYPQLTEEQLKYIVDSTIKAVTEILE